MEKEEECLGVCVCVCVCVVCVGSVSVWNSVVEKLSCCRVMERMTHGASTRDVESS